MNFSDLVALSREQRRGLVLVAIAAIGLNLFYISLAHGHPLATSQQSSSEKIIDPLGSASPTPIPSPSVRPSVVVDVAGRVRHPGVYTLVAGSRAVDAISAAGGAKIGVDLSDINLAEVLFDGEQILVGALISPGPTASKSKGAPTASHFPIHLNTATATQLDQLPGIGPVMAARIVDYRKQHGAFLLLADLRKVKGMGASKFEEIKSLLVL